MPTPSAFRNIPSIDELLTETFFRTIEAEAGRRTALAVARQATEILRERLSIKDESVDHYVVDIAREIWDRQKLRGIRSVINATGAIIHTNLGRSPLPDSAIEVMSKAAANYCTLEYDTETGKRGKRGEQAEALITELTGAEAAVIVNNCAAAAFLTLRTLAAGREVIISRGELVEIGGDFRVPDVLAESGAILREVGTTNRTKLKDYETAINENTGMILRVHPSNYRIIGFTESPTNKELATLAQRHGITFFEDAGSGVLVDLSRFGLKDEPVISRSIADGADLVAFSGDKLLGGVQAGFVVGKKELVEQIRKHPLYRALRVDKLSYAAIEATLKIYHREEHFEEIPTLKMLSITNSEIRERAERLVASLKNKVGEQLDLELIEGESVIGGGSAPDVTPKTFLISIAKDGTKPEELERQLRLTDPPVIARIADDQLLIDLRTVFEDQEQQLETAIADLRQKRDR